MDNATGAEAAAILTAYWTPERIAAVKWDLERGLELLDRLQWQPTERRWTERIGRPS